MAHARVHWIMNNQSLSYRSDEGTLILSALSIFLMIYREQSNEINIGTRPSIYVFLTRAAKVLFRDATDLQYQILLINMISHVATAVDHEVSQGSYIAQSSELAKRQQAHVAIEVLLMHA